MTLVFTTGCETDCTADPVSLERVAGDVVSIAVAADCAVSVLSKLIVAVTTMLAARTVKLMLEAGTPSTRASPCRNSSSRAVVNSSTVPVSVSSTSSS